VIVIADTSGIIAASDRNARESAACRKILQQAGTVVISPLVLTEVDHLAKARFGGRAPGQRSSTSSSARLGSSASRSPTRASRSWTPPASSSAARRPELDLADAANVGLAAQYRTDAVLTLDRRDFRAMSPLTPHKWFRLLPDDL
jgi:uncharacterized protein